MCQVSGWGPLQYVTNAAFGPGMPLVFTHSDKSLSSLHLFRRPLLCVQVIPMDVHLKDN